MRLPYARVIPCSTPLVVGVGTSWRLDNLALRPPINLPRVRRTLCVLHMLRYRNPLVIRRRVVNKFLPMPLPRRTPMSPLPFCTFHFFRSGSPLGTRPRFWAACTGAQRCGDANALRSPHCVHSTTLSKCWRAAVRPPIVHTFQRLTHRSALGPARRLVARAV